MRPRVKPQYGATTDESWRDANMSRLLFTAGHLFEHDLLELLRSRGFPEIRLVDLVLYRSLDTAGTRLTDLAARAAMTKQGMKELVDQAEKQGFVHRVQSSHDRRAKLVNFTSRGRELLETLHESVILTDRVMRSVIGDDDFEKIGYALLAYLHARGITSMIAAGQKPATPLPIETLDTKTASR